ncbi:hypothetical protein LJK88_40710 [Paenibacillus sp. P26]|nr:hypothetical protein LJK88_40710 [Paenibacillus sp. P26]
MNKILSAAAVEEKVEGVSAATWGILLNAVIDGLALQALLNEQFPRDEVYGALEIIITHLMKG